MPKHDYLEYFYPEYRLHMPVSNMENVNTPEYLNSILEQIDNHLKNIHVSTAEYKINEGYVISILKIMNRNILIITQMKNIMKVNQFL